METATKVSAKSTEPKRRRDYTVPIRFRFPVKQTSETTFEVLMSTNSDVPLAVIPEDTAALLHLSDGEFDRASQAATEAVLREILIVR